MPEKPQTPADTELLRDLERLLAQQAESSPNQTPAGNVEVAAAIMQLTKILGVAEIEAAAVLFTRQSEVGQKIGVVQTGIRRILDRILGITLQPLFNEKNRNNFLDSDIEWTKQNSRTGVTASTALETQTEEALLLAERYRSQIAQLSSPTKKAAFINPNRQHRDGLMAPYCIDTADSLLKSWQSLSKLQSIALMLGVEIPIILQSQREATAATLSSLSKPEKVNIHKHGYPNDWSRSNHKHTYWQLQFRQYSLDRPKAYTSITTQCSDGKCDKFFGRCPDRDRGLLESAATSEIESYKASLTTQFAAIELELKDFKAGKSTTLPMQIGTLMEIAQRNVIYYQELIQKYEAAAATLHEKKTS